MTFQSEIPEKKFLLKDLYLGSIMDMYADLEDLHPAFYCVPLEGHIVKNNIPEQIIFLKTDNGYGKSIITGKEYPICESDYSESQYHELCSVEDGIISNYDSLQDNYFDKICLEEFGMCYCEYDYIPLSVLKRIEEMINHPNEVNQILIRK